MSYTYDYPRPAVTADVVVINTLEQVLLIRRKYDPYKGSWALPGGFMEIYETLIWTAIRELSEETGIVVPPSDLDFVGFFDEVYRDTRQRVISFAFLVDNIAPSPLSHGDDAADAQWFDIDIDTLPVLAFDHARILREAVAYRETLWT